MKRFTPEIVLALVIFGGVLLGGLILASGNGGISGKLATLDGVNVLSPKGSRYVEIVEPSGFVNTDPLMLKDLIGKKVIIVDFMTYSCINCQRTFPFLVSWYEKYKDDGLEIVGIHTPEFAFEKNIENVRKAMLEFGITFPIVLDNDYATWRAYGNHYWPHKYLIDINGNIVYDHIGEGAYEETELKIQELLAERTKVLGEGEVSMPPLSDIAPVKVESASPETYFGASRNEFLGNGRQGVVGVQNFYAPTEFTPNTLYFDGQWDVKEEYSANVEAGGRIIFRFMSSKVYLVASANNVVRAEIKMDGRPLSRAEAGEDIVFDNDRSFVTISESRLYKLFTQPSAEEHVLEIIPQSSGLEAYTLTFG